MAEEKDFENKVKAFLKTQGCWFVKYWSGGSMNGMKFTKDGVPDILVCCCGKFIGVEIKASRGKPSALQIHNLKQIDKAGGVAVLLYPKDYKIFEALIFSIKDHGSCGSQESYFWEIIQEWERKLDDA